MNAIVAGNRLLIATVCTFAAGCAESAPVPLTDEIAFLETVRYGWRELSDSTRTLSDVERKYGGAVLSNIAGMAVTGDGKLLVLDRDFQKIVVFRDDGEFAGLILGGYGEGPGEFTFPRHISIDANGRIIVLDRGNMRVTLFDPAGKYIADEPVGFEALQAAISSDSLYLLDIPKAGRSALRGRQLGGTPDAAIRVLLPDSRMAHFADYGEPGALASTPDGEILYAHPSPGRWFDGKLGLWLGTELFPDIMGERLEDEYGEIRFIRAGTRAIGPFPGGKTVIAFANVARPGSPAADTTHILIFDDNGKLTRHGVLNDSIRVRHVITSRGSESLYAAYDEPYPHIRKISLVPFEPEFGQ